MTRRCQIREFSHVRGFGFAVVLEGGDLGDIFVHAYALGFDRDADEDDLPSPGDIIDAELELTHRGWRATSARAVTGD